MSPSRRNQRIIRNLCNFRQRQSFVKSESSRNACYKQRRRPAKVSFRLRKSHDRTVVFISAHRKHTGPLCLYHKCACISILCFNKFPRNRKDFILKRYRKTVQIKPDVRRFLQTDPDTCSRQYKCRQTGIQRRIQYQLQIRPVQSGAQPVQRKHPHCFLNIQPHSCLSGCFFYIRRIHLFLYFFLLFLTQYTDLLRTHNTKAQTDSCRNPFFPVRL